MFSEWSVEAYYLTFLQLSDVPHTVQKITETINGNLPEKIIYSFIKLTIIGQLFVGIYSSGFKTTHRSERSMVFYWTFINEKITPDNTPLRFLENIR
jgi:hypothetical protein